MGGMCPSSSLAMSHSITSTLAAFGSSSCHSISSNRSRYSFTHGGFRSLKCWNLDQFLICIFCPKKRATPAVSPLGVGGLAQYQQTACVTLLRNAAKRLTRILTQLQTSMQGGRQLFSLSTTSGRVCTVPLRAFPAENPLCSPHRCVRVQLRFWRNRPIHDTAVQRESNVDT